ncbi:cytochrome c [Limibacter armeniacum]|uniref:c-type cytochrome n=1 Tax=Limibacter armeniacum TaxID=466084 RepID=UPI002FE549D4
MRYKAFMNNPKGEIVSRASRFFMGLSLLVVASCTSMPSQNQTQSTEQVANAREIYNTNCRSCHGEEAVRLRSEPLKHGTSLEEIKNSIVNGYPDKGMPSWGNVLENEEVDLLATYLKDLYDKPLEKE